MAFGFGIWDLGFEIWDGGLGLVLTNLAPVRHGDDAHAFRAHMLLRPVLPLGGRVDVYPQRRPFRVHVERGPAIGVREGVVVRGMCFWVYSVTHLAGCIR